MEEGENPRILSVFICAPSVAKTLFLNSEEAAQLPSFRQTR
jgi:hypothetical protein